MPSPFPNLPPDQRGTVHRLWLDSTALIGNPWGDPVGRDLFVVEPLGHAGRPLPAIVVLAPFSGTGEKLLARGLSEESLAARLDRLFAEGCPPFRAVLPDAMTSVVGSQYVDSPGIGRYATYVADDMRAAVEAAFPTTRWGVVGRSSGGFGALHLAMSRPGVFSAVGAHAADLGFDLCYLADLPAAVTGVRALGGLDGFVAAFWSKHDPPGSAFAAMNVLCMACAYSPDPAARPVPARLPVDFETGEVDFDVLASWRAFDPVVRVADPAQRDALSALDLLFLDAGRRDEHHLQLGLRRFVRALTEHGVAHLHEEFDGGHRGTTWRFDASLPRIAAALSAPRGS